jgi:hypothetical protein
MIRVFNPKKVLSEMKMQSKKSIIGSKLDKSRQGEILPFLVKGG